MTLRYPTAELADEMVQLRPWAPGDLDCVRLGGLDERIVETTSVPVPFTAEAGAQFIERQRSRAERGEGWSFAIADRASDRAVGMLYLAVRPQPEVVGIGCWLIPAQRGRGLATRAVRLATEWALGPADQVRVEAWVEPDNTPSQRVLEAARYTREGTLRSFLRFGTRRTDALVYSRTVFD